MKSVGRVTVGMGTTVKQSYANCWGNAGGYTTTYTWERMGPSSVIVATSKENTMPKHKAARYKLPDELPGQHCITKNQWHYHIKRLDDKAREWYLDIGWAVSTGCMLPGWKLGNGYPPTPPPAHTYDNSWDDD